MTLTLADYRARLAARLIDASNAVFAAATLDEALRTALDDYTTALPLTAETVITLPGAGREIALNGLGGLLQVLAVWWPYDSLAGEAWPPNAARGFRLWWDDAQPVLFLDALDGRALQAGDELRLWYTRPHTIQDLDEAAATTVFAHHAGGLVTGAAGYAAASEHIDQAGSVRLDPDEGRDLGGWAAARLKEFRAWLETLKTGPGAGGATPPWGAGWQLDKWDAR